MSRQTHSQNKQITEPLDIRTEWQTGPRTPAWDRLWRTILADLHHDDVAGGQHELGREANGG